MGGFAVGAAAVAGLMGLLGAASADTTPAAQIASNAATTPVSQPVPQMITPDDHKHMLMQYCTACHNDKLKTAGMSVVPLDANNRVGSGGYNDGGGSAGPTQNEIIYGNVTGGIGFGILADRLGRVRVLTWTIVVFSVFTGLCAFAQGYWDLVIYRTIAGLAGQPQ